MIFSVFAAIALAQAAPAASALPPPDDQAVAADDENVITQTGPLVDDTQIAPVLTPEPQPETNPISEIGKAGSEVVKSLGETAKSGAEEGGKKATRLINDIQDISFGQIVFIILLTWTGIWLSRKILPFLAKRGPSQMRLYLLGAVPIIRLFLLVTAILWIFPLVFNVTLQNFLVIAGAASVAIGFAFKDYASSLIAGIVAIFERPYRPGDWVEIDGDYGEVKAVGLRAISLNTADDNVITVPHDRIWTNNISNANDGARTLMCIADFYLAPGHDGARMRSVLWDVAISSAYLNYNKPVLVMLKETPWGTHYKLKAYPFDLRDQFSFISDLTVRGKLAIADAGGVVVTAPAAIGEDGQAL